MKRSLAYVFAAFDVLAIIALVSIAILTATSDIGDPLHVLYANNAHGSSYDPYLWLALAPLDFFTLVVNLYMIYDALDQHRKEGYRLPKLMVIMLWDNIYYLVP